MHRNLPFNELFAPVDVPAGGELTSHDIFKILDEDDPQEVIDLKPSKGDEKEEKKEKETKDESVDEKPEKEEETEEETETEDEEGKEEKGELELEDEELGEIPEEGLELITPVRRKEILAKYPNLFKDFPYLNSAYYREQAFTQIFPDPEDAKVALDAKQTLDKFEADLVNGDIKPILESVKKVDENTFHHLIDNLFEVIKSVDERSYNHMIGNVIKSTVYAMARHAKQTDNKQLKQSAADLHEYIFGNTEFEMPGKLAKDVPPNKEETDKVVQKEREYLQRQFGRAQNELVTRVDKVLRATIEANIDPKESMPPFVKRHSIQEVIDAVTGAIKRDARFKANLDRLWEQALKTEFNETSVKKIKDSYLSKAKTLLPEAIKKTRNEALKGLGKKTKEGREVEIEEEESTETEEKRSSSPPKRTQQQDRGKEKGKPAHMSTREYLMSDL